MGKRYYCDYCDKSFADTPTNRRLHLTGGIHQKNKRAHYDAVRDEREILRDDLHKKPCRSYMSTGDCRFGDRCQYSHLTDADKAKLATTIRKKELAREKRLKDGQKKLAKLGDVLPDWLAKRSKKIQTSEEESESSSKIDHMKIPDYEIAECLRGIPNLPPSLTPPTKVNILNGHYAEWG